MRQLANGGFCVVLGFHWLQVEVYAKNIRTDIFKTFPRQPEPRSNLQMNTYRAPKSMPQNQIFP